MNEAIEVKTAEDVRPLDDRILVRVFEADEKTKGGIVIPDNAKEKPARGEVVAVGPGRLLDSGERAAVALKVGMVVLYSKWSGTELKLDGVDHLILREPEVMAVLGPRRSG